MEKIKLIYRKDSEGNFHGVCNMNERSINSFGRTLEDCIENMRIAIDAFEAITEAAFELQETTNEVISASTFLNKYAEEAKVDEAILIAMQEYAKAKCAEQRQLIQEHLAGVNLKHLPEPQFA
ncbi:MAG: hypothetical protein ACTHJ5_14530 [Ilyomonas sp.]